MNIEDLELVEYTEDMGRVEWPLGFEQVLSGKPIAGQVRHYMVHSRNYIPLAYYMLNWTTELKNGRLEPLDAYGGWEKIILRDGLAVGFVRNGRTILPYRVVDSDSTYENNGAGYKESTDYYYLACVPGKLEQEFVYTPPFGAPVPELTIPVIPYDGSRGENPLPEGFGERLTGKSLSVQMYYFGIVDDMRRRKQQWEDDWHRYSAYHISDYLWGRFCTLHQRNDLEALIVQNDRIVGVRIHLKEGTVSEKTVDLYPYEGFSYEYAVEYSKWTRSSYLQLICSYMPG